ncbi:MAG: hypothetical protein FWG67_08025 [Defluviitaleaceae bacterium]|nr:hypothetical protein [Defluviitaleaceae bacterium]
MFGRCCPRPRPMCGPAFAPVMPFQPMGHGMAPICPVEAAGVERPVIPLGGDCQVNQNPQTKVVVEPTLLAAPNVFHHHQNVQHIQPVVTQDIHHYHSHHNYVVQEQKKADEVLNHAHGLCGPAVTQPATPCGPTPSCSTMW